jgi:hypothetical protein
MHEVQLRKCSGKAAKDRGKFVKTLAWKLADGIVNSHPKEPARYNCYNLNQQMHTIALDLQ